MVPQVRRFLSLEFGRKNVSAGLNLAARTAGRANSVWNEKYRAKLFR